MVVMDEGEYLAHYGVLRRSGRYPWGSGGLNDETPTRNQDFLGYIDELKAEGMSDTEIYKAMGISSTEYRARRSIARNEERVAKITQAQTLKDKGYGPTKIGERMGIGESTVRSLLAPGAKEKADVLITTANVLRKHVDEKTYLDVGKGVSNDLKVSQVRLNTALEILKQEGYNIHEVKTPQLTTGFDTRRKVLVPPGVTQRDAFLNQDKIRLVNEWSEDGGHKFIQPQKPMPIDPSRIDVVYGPDGGAKADGVMYIRPGVKDLSIGQNKYAQVRVLVGKDRYLKGMAMQYDNMPDGVDILFHTNKPSTGNKLDVLKKVEAGADPLNPFGANIARQIIETDSKGKEKITSVMNIVNDEGDWDKWGDNISSQMLSKQSPALAKSQLDMKFEQKQIELNGIKALSNPTIKKRLLESFADSADSSAVHLEAAALPRQGWHVILPMDKMPMTQIYAPNYDDGERVALIRYPHGGTFEIPELTVNNKNPQAKKLIGPESKHAVGIHHSVAERLSGADFDGDTVLVIPNRAGRLTITPALERLKGFHPHEKYPKHDGMIVMTKERTQQEMGKISNLITDMTIKGAPPQDLARAIMHSMVVIDAEKHELNFKQSEKDNGIAQLKKEYQGGSRAGASTLISRAGAEQRIDERKPRTYGKGGPVDKVTGEKMYEPSGKMRRTKSGELIPKQERVDKLAITKDAHELLSDRQTRMEKLYADHSNRLKAMANGARLEALHTPPLKKNASAARAYEHEVASLNAKLDLALRAKPLMRQADTVANTIYRAKVNANPNMDGDTKKKEKNRAVKEARIRTGAAKHMVVIEPKEWEAIQQGAISDSKLNEILNNTDLDKVKEMATPHKAKLMTSSKTKRAQAMLADGYTRAEVAKHLGVSLTTLDTATVS